METRRSTYDSDSQLGSQTREWVTFRLKFECFGGSSQGMTEYKGRDWESVSLERVQWYHRATYGLNKIDISGANFNHSLR